MIRAFLEGNSLILNNHLGWPTGGLVAIICPDICYKYHIHYTFSSFNYIILCIVLRLTLSQQKTTKWKVTMVIVTSRPIQKLSLPPFICRKQKTTTTTIDCNAVCFAVAQNFCSLWNSHGYLTCDDTADFVELDLFQSLEVHLKLLATHIFLVKYSK